MSSHHIVRENQEPALLIIDVDAISEEWLGQLLEWSPLVMTTWENVDFLLSRGIKIDVVFSKDEIPIDIQENTVSIAYETESQLYKAVSAYLESKEQFALYVLCDEVSVKRQELFCDERFTIVALKNNIRYRMTANFEKWLPKGQKILIGCADSTFVTKGLTRVDRGAYHVTQDGFVRINAADGQKLLIGERL